jgi:glycosyltransferase involved in cell wall biosynthesis
MHSNPRAQSKGITLVAGDGLLTGIGRYAANLAATGLSSELLLFKKKEEIPEEGYNRVIRAGRSLPDTLSVPLSFFGPSSWSDEVRRLRAVHFLAPDLFYLAKYTKRAVGTIHDFYPLDRNKRDDYSVRYRMFFRASLGHARHLRGIVSVSNWTRQQLLALMPDLDVTVIHHWTGDQFSPRDKGGSRAALRLPEEGRIVLSVGSSALQKNVAAISETMNILGPDYHLIRIGDSQRLAKTLRYPRSATLLHKVGGDELPFFYNAADVLLFPSYDEGFGFPIIESINSGTPVVASDIPVFREILGAEYPCLAPADSPSAQSELVQRMCDPVSNSQTVKWMANRFGSYYREGRATEEYREFYSRFLSS